MPSAGEHECFVGAAQPGTQPGHVVGEQIVDQLDGTRGRGDGRIEPSGLELTEPQTVGVARAHRRASARPGWRRAGRPTDPDRT